ncbi:uncharacterized protein LOC143035676 [Oratosquilla oratoria]|uniref:uncharacterized protein LOC143035676 n=1 Tax=Oratosquilla oratoria TaxID=337810 RepID=UPI003F7754DD
MRRFRLALEKLGRDDDIVITSADKGGGVTVGVATFNEDGQRRITTWMKYNTTIRIGVDMTLCFRFNIGVFRLLTAVIYIQDIAHPDSNPVSLDVYFEKIRPKVGGYGRFYPLPANLATNKWYHYCQIRDMTGGKAKVYLEGELIMDEPVVLEEDLAERHVLLGQEGEYQEPYSLSGKLSQVNAWSQVFTDDEVKRLADCEVDPQGDIISWSGEWVISEVDIQVSGGAGGQGAGAGGRGPGASGRGRGQWPVAGGRWPVAGRRRPGPGPGVVESTWNKRVITLDIHSPLRQRRQLREVELPSLCRSLVEGDVPVHLPLLRYSEAVRVCQGLGGSMAFINDSKKMIEEIDLFPEGNECSRKWGSISDSLREGYWLDPFLQRSFTPNQIFFRKNNPDGDIYQNCVRLFHEGFRDTDCKRHSCSICHTRAPSTWNIRGICEDEMRMYYFDLENEPLGFRGYGEYAVRRVNGIWTLYDAFANRTLARLFRKDEDDLDFPIGRQNWQLESPICKQESGKRVLSLSSCALNQFSCSDGSCIPFGSRCDLKFDCLDDSDESQCEIVNFPEDYRSKLPPRPVSNLALPISINVSMDTINIDTTTMLVSVSYNLRMSWFDNRLSYNNLKVLTRLNTLASEQVDVLWRPIIGFINTDEIQHTHVDQEAVTVIIRDDINFVRDFSNPNEVEIYSGDTNPVSTTRKYSTVYTCNFDLVLYPFDIQSCFLQLKILSASSEYIIFNQTNSFVDYLGPTSLIEYGIGGIDLLVNNATQYSEARVRIELIRRYGYAMLNIYIPSLTLLTISYVTLFFRPTIFEVRVMTALTALLVLATLFTQVSASLPKTSYFKMVDIWLLFCIIVIFIIIIWHTIIDIYVDYDKVTDPSIPRMDSDLHHRVQLFKVKPISGGDDDDFKQTVELSPAEKKEEMARTLVILLLVSKILTFFLFAIFNITYWGTLSVESGLVYSKSYQRVP